MDEKTARKLLFSRAEGWCEFCGNGAIGIQYDHRCNRSQIPGKKNQWHLSNAFGLCPPCHKRKTENPAWAAERGLQVWSHQTPSEIPVLRRGKWVLLNDEGGFTSCSINPAKSTGSA